MNSILLKLSNLWFRISCTIFLLSAGTLFSEETESFERTTRQTMPEIISSVGRSVVTIRTFGRDGDEIGVGTGFVVDSSGLVATAHHVIGEGRQFSVTTSNGRELPVLAVEASDRLGDLALLRLDRQRQNLHAIKFRTEDLHQGSEVLAFGNPLGLEKSVTSGIVFCNTRRERSENDPTRYPLWNPVTAAARSLIERATWSALSI